MINLVFLFSNFCRVLNVVCFLLGNFPVSEFYMPPLRNTLSVPSSQAGRCVYNERNYLPMKMERAECSETSAYKIHTPGNYQKESIQKTLDCLGSVVTDVIFPFSQSGRHCDILQKYLDRRQEE